MKYWLYIGMLCLLGACQAKTYRHTEGGIYGTYYRITYRADRDLGRELIGQLERVNASLSMFNDSSVISRLNRGQTDRVDSLFAYMFRMAVQVNRETEGAFDITVAPLSNAWGFGYKRDSFPLPEKIDSLLQYVGMGRLRLEEGRLLKEKEGIEMDASSIAKGLGVDLAADYLQKQGVEDYMVDIGGEIRVKGVSDKNRPWRVGIDKPIDDPEVENRQLELVVELTKGAIATSGNYRNYYIHEGKKYAHTLNPLTGYPVQRDILSSSVYALTCMEADAYATAFMVLGLEKSKEIVLKHPGLEVCFVYEQDGKSEIWMSPGFEKMVLK